MFDQIADIEDNCNQDEICEYILSQYPSFEKYKNNGILKKVAEFQEKLENHWDNTGYIKGVDPSLKGYRHICDIENQIKNSSLPQLCKDCLEDIAEKEKNTYNDSSKKPAMLPINFY